MKSAEPMFRPRQGIWQAGLGTMALVASVLAAVAIGMGRVSPPLDAPPDVTRRAEAAEALVRRAGRLIRLARRAEGIASEAEDADPMSSLLGADVTPLTTTLGNLEAKRLATNPEWARILVVRLGRAGLRKGDVVAAGFSGSFPGLNLALSAACQSSGVRLMAISSVTASSWGANQPGFTWPEIEERLVLAGVLQPVTIAVTVGGAGDRGFDLEVEARAAAQEIAGKVAVQMRVPLLQPAGFEQAVEMRLDAYEKASRGVLVSLYANVGGTEASLGRSPAVLKLRNGFLPGVPFDFSPWRGVMARYAERGIPVLTLLNVRDLALRWGIL
jgi:poly-gamma-glutamate system protein